MPKILIATNFAHNLAHKRSLVPGTGNYSFYRAFQKAGHEARALSLDRKGFNGLQSLSDYLWKFLWFHIKDFPEADEKRFQSYAVRKVKELRPDMIFTVVGNRLRPETVKEMSGHTGANVLWCGLDPERAEWNNVIASVPYYTHIFTVDPHWIPKFEKWGGKNIYQQDLGVDEEFFKPVELDPSEKAYYSNDINFVGQWDADRVSFFEELADLNIGVWGHGWTKNVPKGSPLFPKLKPFVIGAEVAKVYNACKIVVNVHTPFTDYGINMRTFEAAGCGAFQIVDRKEGIFKLFKEGEDIVTFGDIADLREKIKYYLEHEEERKRIAAKTRERILRDHRYSDLAENVLRITL